MYGDYHGKDKPNKGHEGGACNRSLCQAEPALYHNHGTPGYWYCADCARDIGQDPVNLHHWNQDWADRIGAPQFETREEWDTRLHVQQVPKESRPFDEVFADLTETMLKIRNPIPDRGVVVSGGSSEAEYATAVAKTIGSAPLIIGYDPGSKGTAVVGDIVHTVSPKHASQKFLDQTLYGEMRGRDTPVIHADDYAFGDLITDYEFSGAPPIQIQPKTAAVSNVLRDMKAASKNEPLWRKPTHAKLKKKKR